MSFPFPSSGKGYEEFFSPILSESDTITEVRVCDINPSFTDKAVIILAILGVVLVVVLLLLFIIDIF